MALGRKFLFLREGGVRGWHGRGVSGVKGVVSHLMCDIGRKDRTWHTCGNLRSETPTVLVEGPVRGLVACEIRVKICMLENLLVSDDIPSTNRCLSELKRRVYMNDETGMYVRRVVVSSTASSLPVTHFVAVVYVQFCTAQTSVRR